MAPTGKAAAVMRKRSKKVNAYTIHQVIFSFRNWNRKDSEVRGPWKFSDTRIVAVDEASMVSLEVSHSITIKPASHFDLRTLKINYGTRL